MVYTVSLINYREPVKQLGEWIVTATDLMFPSEDIGIHITIQHIVAPRNVYTKG